MAAVGDPGQTPEQPQIGGISSIRKVFTGMARSVSEAWSKAAEKAQKVYNNNFSTVKVSVEQKGGGVLIYCLTKSQASRLLSRVDSQSSQNYGKLQFKDLQENLKRKVIDKQINESDLIDANAKVKNFSNMLFKGIEEYAKSYSEASKEEFLKTGEKHMKFCMNSLPPEKLPNLLRKMESSDEEGVQLLSSFVKERIDTNNLYLSVFDEIVTGMNTLMSMDYLEGGSMTDNQFTERANSIFTEGLKRLPEDQYEKLREKMQRSDDDAIKKLAKYIPSQKLEDT